MHIRPPVSRSVPSFCDVISVHKSIRCCSPHEGVVTACAKLTSSSRDRRHDSRDVTVVIAAGVVARRACSAYDDTRDGKRGVRGGRRTARQTIKASQHC